MTGIPTRTLLTILISVLLALLLLGGFSWHRTTPKPPTPATPFPHTSTAASESTDAIDPARPTAGLRPFTPPLSRAAERVSKKPFGIRVSPTNSPVSPEKFTGIHTGTDFEAFPEEAHQDVPVHAICSGPLLRKQQARGYGGMVVQGCTLDGNPITVVYGHLKLESVGAKLNEQLEQGVILGLLGNGYSRETDGERKHLHLGVHQGPSVVTNGYIANQTNLNNWLDIMQYIQ
ncbi:MAG: M23 family metallopeptidase [Candidatus Doudnabacteria bacterium]|nr:M23 family metallopeptidase [Candidatus Doudnabacteria bacterium]